MSKEQIKYDADFLKHGTVSEHLATINRAIDNGIDNVWSGDITHNKYLQENLLFAQKNGLLIITEEIDYDMQMSYLILNWNVSS